jgi:F-type H+-transporting ATPase subunit epsilon
MNTFTLHLYAADRYERIDEVASFVGEDESGSFGLLARHDRFMTVLTFGLARLRHGDGATEFLGLPGGVLYFVDNALRLSTRRYLRDTDARRIAQALAGELLEEEQALAETRRKLHLLEAEMLKRLVELGRE